MYWVPPKAKQNTVRLCICLSVCRMRFQRGQPSPSVAQREVCGSVKRNCKVNLRLVWEPTSFQIARNVFCTVPHSQAPCQ
ncbi:rCG20790 [Rattus norvegicus]|uniref:RCG20790 n=1 Tax=Rattus norvegicus TaxID=10116 RepID=A6JE27_RAT|nr:rCG20790 [Rattus norvegicus]